MTEEDIKKIIESPTFRQEFDKYYRRKYPTFEITGGGPSAKHGRTEYALTTVPGEQMIHFYESGVAKISSNKSFELYSCDLPVVHDGKGAGDGDVAIKLNCKHGRIKIQADMSDIELNGRNITLRAVEKYDKKEKKMIGGNINIVADKKITTKSGADTEMLSSADFTIDTTKELFINGGEQVGIHCESEVIHTTSGRDEFLAPDFYRDVTTSINKVDSYN